MKVFVKVFSVLILFSFFWVSWIDFDNETSLVDCEVILGGGDIIINFWESPQIDAFMNRPLSEVEEIIWSPSENLSCTDCLNPVLTITETEDVCISLTVKFNDGCEDSDEMCVYIRDCIVGSEWENNINSITPQVISDTAELEFETSQFQFVQIEIVENDEIINTLFEDWLGRGLHNLNLDFSDVPAGEHSLRLRVYPEDYSFSTNIKA